MKILSIFLFILPAFAPPTGTYYKFEPVGTVDLYSVDIATETVTPVGVGADGATTYVHSAVITGINEVFPAGATGRLTTRHVDTTVTVLETQVMDAEHFEASRSIFLPSVVASGEPYYGQIECSIDAEASSAVCSGEYPIFTGQVRGDPGAIGTTTFTETQTLIPFATFEASQATGTSTSPDSSGSSSGTASVPSTPPSGTASVPSTASSGSASETNTPDAAGALLPFTGTLLVVFGTIIAVLL